MRVPPAILINTAQEGQELHFEEGRENQSLSSLWAARYRTPCGTQMQCPGRTGCRNFMEVLCQCLTAPCRLQTHVCLSPHPTAVLSSLLISALPCAPVCPAAAAAGARSGVWAQALRVQWLCPDTHSEELQVTPRAVTTAQWLHTGLKAPRWHSWTQQLLLSIPSLI